MNKEFWNYFESKYGYIQRFSKEDEFREFIDDMVYSYGERVKEIDELEEQVVKLEDLREGIDEVVMELMDIEDIEIDYDEKKDNSTHVDQEIGKCVKKLEAMSAEDWEPEHKKSKKKKK